MVEPCDFLSQLLELPLQAAPNEGVVRLQQSPPLGVALFDQLLTPPDQSLQTDLRGAWWRKHRAFDHRGQVRQHRRIDRIGLGDLAHGHRERTRPVRRDTHHRPLRRQHHRHGLLIPAGRFQQDPTHLVVPQPATQGGMSSGVIADIQSLPTRVQRHGQAGLGHVDSSECLHHVLPSLD